MFATSPPLADRPTPLLRWGRALLKLELYRAPRTLPAQPFAATGHHALTRARPGMQVALRGAVTHEMLKTLEIWNAQLLENAEPWQPDPAALVRELVEEIAEAPSLVVAPAADSSALSAVLVALRSKWPGVRGIALLAADIELPDLPLQAELPDGLEQVRVSFAQATAARARVARTLGLLASHASAAAAVHAEEHGGLALVTAPGEREFSLETR
jgi:cysteine synthase